MIDIANTPSVSCGGSGQTAVTQPAAKRSRPPIRLADLLPMRYRTLQTRLKEFGARRSTRDAGREAR